MDEDQDNSEADQQIEQFTEPSELQNYNCEDNSPVEGSSHREEQTELGANEQDNIVASKKKLKFDLIWSKEWVRKWVVGLTDHAIAHR